ncbi:Hsp20/alpha crystallin family protein [Hymenobacter sp. BT175]|uniref:Hsp20/alpha crystallin family protein n=1 Tax=Hymenobacter translucens TaxID=2886507 RepID=UPI001D0ED4B1|nr:Hsp20/alpha crystallin family protein [Hymenobacter translucens]MCC2548376.1 Hsp20/alpha crystallin family protein [Hymenobacter translucens]
MATLLYNNRPSLRPAKAFNSMLNEVLRETLPALHEPSQSFVPQADILESETGFEILLTVPGVEKDAIKIDFQDGSLLISGERKSPVNEEDEKAPKLRRVESAYGSFSRSFRLPDTIDVTAIDAQLTNGVLHVLLPFDSKKVTKYQIEVR